MARTKLVMVLFFTIFSFLFIFPFQLTMAQAPAPATSTTPATPATGTAGATPGTAATNTPVTAPAPPTRCSASQFTPVTVPLQQLLTVYVAANITISGTINTVGSCNFTVTGFTYTSAVPESYWFGSNGTDTDTAKILISDTPVGQFINQPSVNYGLRSDVSFDDFDVLNLYSLVAKDVIAQAVLKQGQKSTSSTKSVPTINPLGGTATSLLINQNMLTKIIIGSLVAFFVLV